MKGIKKSLALILCFVLLFTTLPVVVSSALEDASGDYYYEIENGKATIIRYTNTSETTVSIPSTLGGYPVTSIGDGAFANKTNITQLTIPEGVISIGNSSFAACMGLKQITFAKSILSIGEAAFYSCVSLNTITLPEKLTVVPSEIFAECPALRTVILPTGITTIGSGAFKECYNLNEINIPNTVTLISANAFYENHNLNVYYCGTEQEWNKIKIDQSNPSLSENTVKYHKYTYVRVEATCSELAHTLYTCSICNYSYIITDPDSNLTDHIFEENFTIDKEPTDFEEGLKSRHCKYCDAVTDVTVIPTTSLAGGHYSDSVKWIIKKDGTLTILGTGSVDNYKLPVYTPWHQYSAVITSLEISKDVTYLGNNAFSSLENLDLVIVNGDCTEFGYYVFQNSSDLIVKCYTGSPADYYAQKFDHTITYFGAAEVPVIESINGTTATLKKLDGYEYSIDRYSWQKSNIFTIEQNTIITFYQRIAETEISMPSPSSDAAKGISVSAPDVVLVGYDVISIKPVPDFEYGLEGVLWQEDNQFTKWIIPDVTYTVYQRYNGDEDVFAVYDTNGTNITVSGNNKPLQKNATYLTWLKSHLFTAENSNNLAADVNNDYSIDVLDLISLKTQLLEE